MQSCYQGLSLRGQGQDFFLKAKAIKIFQGQLSQLPLRAKICIAVTETEYAYLIKHNAKEMICAAFGLKIMSKNSPSRATWTYRITLISVTIVLSTSLHCEATDMVIIREPYELMLLSLVLPG